MTSKDGFLRDVLFNPAKSVTYRPIPNKQMAEVQVSNNEQTAIIFKWKSTRPGMYKMRPVYGVLAPGETANISLFCKGVKDQAPLTDHFSCVLASSPSANVNPESIWSNHKYQQKLAQSGKLRKLKLKILYLGLNDQEKDDDKEKEKDKDKEEEDEEKEKDKEKQEAMKKKKQADGKKKPTLIMFTRKEGDSLSGEDENDNTPTVAAPAQQNIMDLLKPVRNAGVFQNQTQANPQPIPGYQNQSQLPPNLAGTKSPAVGGSKSPAMGGTKSPAPNKSESAFSSK
ncbi:unnamed protein product [Caenorhabditis angaria]|uniref:Major sperm protein n=1 Tax=Caenorhabditis angaria TaxID=860376 RepID=A0A9P1IVW0_9PELO|nr:unnamed protein product [Caenorhabditis angaria]